MLSYQQQKELLSEYIKGELPDNILAKKYNISTTVLNNIVENPPLPRTDLEKGILAISIARETNKIIEAKDKMLDFFNRFLDEALNDSNLQKYIPDVRGILIDLDRVQRLNASTPTDILEERSISVLLEKIEMNQGDLVK